MNLFPVALALFYRWRDPDRLDVWTQVRTDDGPFHGLMEFPGGGVEPGETPLEAVVREVQEEVGVNPDPRLARSMGVYENPNPKRTILLYVFLFPELGELEGKGEWLPIRMPELSAPHKGRIPPPNHRIIDDLFRSLYDNRP